MNAANVITRGRRRKHVLNAPNASAYTLNGRILKLGEKIKIERRFLEVHD
jgi:hypothetical protein